MRYKYTKIIKSILCDEHISDSKTKKELIDKIIQSRLNCHIKVTELSSGMVREYKTVKMLSIDSKDSISILIQSKSGSFKTTIHLDDLQFIDISSVEDVVSIDNENNRYQFIDC